MFTVFNHDVISCSRSAMRLSSVVLETQSFSSSELPKTLFDKIRRFLVRSGLNIVSLWNLGRVTFDAQTERTEDLSTRRMLFVSILFSSPLSSHYLPFPKSPSIHIGTLRKRWFYLSQHLLLQQHNHQCQVLFHFLIVSREISLLHVVRSGVWIVAYQHLPHCNTFRYQCPCYQSSHDQNFADQHQKAYCLLGQ